MTINAECSPDMTYFPFDKQNCELTVRTASHNVDKVMLHVLSSTWDMSGYQESNSWEVNQTTLAVTTVNNKSELVMGIAIKRKPLYFSLFIVLPTLLLSLLSGFVFLLPSGSGERVGFGVTCFLSFIVLLQMIMSMLPQVSSPMSLLCYYVIVMLAFSAILNVVNIILMRLHLNPTEGNVPRFLVYFFECLVCKICRRCKKGTSTMVDAETKVDKKIEKTKGVTGDTVGRIKFRGMDPNAVKYGSQSNGSPQNNDTNEQSGDATDKTNHTDTNSQKVSSEDDTDDFETDIDWPMVGIIFDWFFLLVFCGVQALFTIIMLVPLAAQFSDS